MSLFIVTDKATKKTYGVYQVIREEDKNQITALQPWVETLFLIYRDDRWVWVPAKDFEPMDFEGLFHE